MNTGAKIEPRFHRFAWKGDLYDDAVAKVAQLRLDILMLWYAMAGSDGQPDTIFSKFSKHSAFVEIQQDLNETLETAHDLVISVLSHETGAFNGLSKMKTVTGIDELEALPGLINSVNEGAGALKF